MSKRSVMICVRITPALKHRLDHEAKELNEKFSELVRNKLEIPLIRGFEDLASYVSATPEEDGD